MTEFCSGFVCIIGCTNVGKSTLINGFAGQKIAITSNRPQTTRNRIHGVLNRPGLQIVFVDTPGINKPKNKLGEYMFRIANEALNEVECILFVVDAKLGLKEHDAQIIERLRNAKAPVVAAINKIDLVSEQHAQEVANRLSDYDCINSVVKISAKNSVGLEDLIAELAVFMRPGPQYYPDDMVTDQPERVICAEFIREKALLLLEEEIPHGIGVEIEKIHRRPDDMLDIYATIFCEKNSHKGIIIGKSGATLKKIGMYSRKDIEWLMGNKVNLQLWVKVKEDWRNSLAHIKVLGYE